VSAPARVVYCLLGSQCALCWWRNTGQYAVPLTGQQWRRILGPRSRNTEEQEDG
jgi:hypothetical protein